MISNNNGNIRFSGNLFELMDEMGELMVRLIKKSERISPIAKDAVVESLIAALSSGIAELPDGDFKEPSKEELKALREMYKEVMKAMKLIAKAMEEQQRK